MADVIKRLKYYNGQFLQEPDFTAEQDYHLDRQRRHNRLLHTPGIAEGLVVTATANTTSASVAPGTAIDGQGRQIVLHEARTVGFPSSLNGQPALVVISYTEEESDDATVGDAGKTRWREVPRVEAILDDGAPTGDRIPLGRLQIAANGTIASHDPSVRTPAGARVRPDETFERLRLSRQGVGSSQWPVLASGAPGRADLAGDLNVTGNVLVAGTVDGRDVSADGARLDNLALSQVGGVSNPGGNIHLVAGGAITITPDNTANKRITISETHSTATGNPHGTTAAQLNQYDLRSRYTSTSEFKVSFTQNDGNGATRTITTGFQPRLIWANGFAMGTLYDYYYGGATAGVARVEDGNIYQNCTGPSVWRYDSGPGIIHWGHLNYSAISSGQFWDYYSATWTNFDVSIKVSSTTATTVTFMLQKPASTPTFRIEINFTCFGY